MTTPFKHFFPAILLVVGVVITLTLVTTACTSSDTATLDGGTGSEGSSPQVATITYTSGTVFATGPVDDQGRRQGEWNIHFEDGAVWWEAHYVDDVFDPTQPWTEYNADGSVRFDSSDGAPPHQPPTTPPTAE